MTSLTSLPRIPLTVGPSPLQPAPRLSAEIGVEVWFKRDDLVGTGLGGNKVRALEYLIADAVERGCDSVVTGAGVHSNWAMLAALVARRCGLSPYLVYYGDPCEPAGNHALAALIDADIRFTGSDARGSVDESVVALSRDLAAEGRRPYPLPRGGATPLGSVGYIRAGFEMVAQLAEERLSPEALWLATGSCGTQAGLLAAARALGSPYHVTGVSVSRPVAECEDRVASLARQAAERVALPCPEGDDVVVHAAPKDPGYGRPSPGGEAAARLVARTEGVFLDPVFGAKAMAALVDAADQGDLSGPVVFLVSGGIPTLFSIPERRHDHGYA